MARFLGAAFGTGGGPSGNPSSVHAAGREARRRLQAARATLASSLGCEPREVCFTGSGTESDALALKGAFDGRKEEARREIVASAVEHPAVLFALEQLKARGAEVTLVKPSASGAISEAEMTAALTDRTLICSLMWANNETGVLQPVAEVARQCRQRGILFHTDAVQAVGKVPVSLRAVDADLLSLAGHKFGGPAGTGALVVRRSVALQSQIPGHQEGGHRGGTPPVALLEALALALSLSQIAVEPEAARLTLLRDQFEQELLASLPGVERNGTGERVGNTSNLLFHGVDGEALLIALDLEGIAVSSGAACASGSLRPSHVLTAMGRTPAEARSSLRFSLGRSATAAEASAVAEAVVRHVLRLRG